MTNPNPARITDAQWRLWLELHALEPDDTELGGILADKSGYHNTRAANDARWPGNYSVRDAEDRRGPADKAAALDWTFRSAQSGDYRNIAKYCARLLASGKDMADPRLNGWREWYGQADADLHVEGWDCRYLCEVTSDSSHLWHIHFSEDRELVEDWANKDALLSVLKAEPLAVWLARTGRAPAPAVPPPPPAPRPQPAPQPSGTWCKGAFRPVLRRGATGDHVRFLQAMIGCKVDGDFGPATEARVRWYQQMRGLGVDGVVGGQTWASINRM